MEDMEGETLIGGLNIRFLIYITTFYAFFLAFSGTTSIPDLFSFVTSWERCFSSWVIRIDSKGTRHRTKTLRMPSWGKKTCRGGMKLLLPELY